MNLFNTLVSQDVIKHIRAVESKLVEELVIDLHNTHHTAKMLDITNCETVLNDCVLPVYCKSIYNKYVYPMYMYLEYCNNYLTIVRIACDQNIDTNKMKNIIDNGRDILNTINS